MASASWISSFEGALVEGAMVCDMQTWYISVILAYASLRAIQSMLTANLALFSALKHRYLLESHYPIHDWSFISDPVKIQSSETLITAFNGKLIYIIICTDVVISE